MYNGTKERRSESLPDRACFDAMRNAFQLLLASLCLAATAGSTQVQAVPRVSICELSAHPTKYQGKIVVATGQLDVSSFLPHGGLLLTSEECSAGAALVESSTMQKSTTAETEAFRSGWDSKWGCMDPRPFVVTVKGRFEIPRGPSGPFRRVVAYKILSAVFHEGISTMCQDRRTWIEVRPPDLKFPPAPLPDVLRSAPSPPTHRP